MRLVHRRGLAEHRLLPEVGAQVVVPRYRLGQGFPQYYRGHRFPRGRVPHFSGGELRPESLSSTTGDCTAGKSVLITFRDRRKKKKTFLICKGLDTAKEFPPRETFFSAG